MKSNYKMIALIMEIVMVINFSIFSTIQVFAHDAMLDVDYDDCVYEMGADGINEMWYVLNKGSVCRHIPHEEDTIKYYFADSVDGSTYTWTTDVSASVAQEIKNAYAESMKKWNNVYFYSYNDNGVLTKHKIINIVEGTESDHNLTIYPVAGTNTIASTNVVGTKDEIESGTISHRHYSEWKMEVNINYFYVHGEYDEAYINLVRERNGAHEFGHVLGLRDVDSSNLCNATTTTQHHHELLMGYGSPMADRSADITYKDIAGVAITRGFHTDSDHKWLNCGLQSNGGYKLVCSICNGIEETANLSGYIYETYGFCGNNHSLSSGNMMAIASYGTKDYYKCKYCRYVAPFSSLVTQNYTKSYYSETVHKSTNQIAGLMYTFFEQHNIVNNQCLGCNGHIHSYDNNFEQYSNIQHKSYCECGEYVLNNHSILLGSCRFCGDPHTHDYSDHYVPETNSEHRSYCFCGEYSIQPHVIEAGAYTSGKKYAICLACGGLATVGMTHHQAIGELPRSANGSFILPDGIIVLVDEDIDAYFNGTLVFYNPNDNLETQ